MAERGLMKPKWPRIMDIRFTIDGKTYFFLLKKILSE